MPRRCCASRPSCRLWRPRAPTPCPAAHAHHQALATFGTDIGIAFSGAEDVALVEYAHLTGRPYRVFRCALLLCSRKRSWRRTSRASSCGRGRPCRCWLDPETRRCPCCPTLIHLPFRCSLDTGRLNPETYRLFDKVEKHYGIRIEYTFPDAQVGCKCMGGPATRAAVGAPQPNPLGPASWPEPTLALNAASQSLPTAGAGDDGPGAREGALLVL